MKRVRSVLFWSHLTAGVVCGVVILVMSFTGAALALKPQILNWIERDVRFVQAQDAPRLGPHAILMAVKSARPDASPASLALDRDPDTAATVNIGTAGNIFVNPYTGAILGTGSAKANRFFQVMTTWHRYMGGEGESRALGKSLTGVSNLAFLALAVTGLYIWWPRYLTRQHLRPITWFRSASTGRARDFNWHNVIGFWCLPAIVIMTVSGAVIGYPWASNLVYRLTGSPIPAARAAGPGGAGAPGGGGEGRGGQQQARAERGPESGGGARTGNVENAVAERRDGRQGERREQSGQGTSERRGSGGRAGSGREGAPPEARGERGGERAGGGATAEAAATVIPARLDEVFARADAQVPTWSLISLRLGNREQAPVTFTITDGAHWNQFARSTLTVNGATAEVAQWQPYSEGSIGQKVRGWLRFAHTGELGRLPGQIIAGLGCVGGCFLVYTGFSLAFRRLWNWSLWGRLGVFGRNPQLVAARESAARAASAAVELQREGAADRG